MKHRVNDMMLRLYFAVQKIHGNEKKQYFLMKRTNDFLIMLNDSLARIHILFSTSESHGYYDQQESLTTIFLK